ncbi:hypothetical protein A0E43_19250 [Pectobacterium cacticida]|uniref:Uncharacterized protein n=1 Tax=Polaromonas sp. E5S TaxID=1840267 RepID=A0A2S1FIZ8_9BURK|nr:hypothetical protein [Polaromonas sp. E5S]AWD72167.1 hypothetical protein pE5SP1_p050 [Polaromonas sp. E5S]
MQSASDYLLRTESAVRLLFSGVDSYLIVLRKATGVTFVTGEPYGPKHDAEFAAWQIANAARLAVARAAERKFIAESFALDTLCGAILQVAGKAIELYGSNTKIPPGLPNTLKAPHAKFCVGRSVRTIPLGLVIYAARNQHIHFNDEALREPSASVFQLLATAHGHRGKQQIIDPAFDLNNQSLLSFASNITSLIDWRSYEKFASDMRQMLGA